MSYPACPEHERLGAVAEFSQCCGEMLDWLQNAKGIILAKYPEHQDMSYAILEPTYVTVDELLAEFFHIDRAKLEAEKKAVLQYVRLKRGE